jgi:hypothetical protein
MFLFSRFVVTYALLLSLLRTMRRAKYRAIPAEKIRVNRPPSTELERKRFLNLRPTGLPKMSISLMAEPIAWKAPFEGF